MVERTQALISEDSRKSLRKLPSIVGVSEPAMRRIAEEDLRYKSYTLKYDRFSPRLPGSSELLAASFGPRNSGLLIAQI